MDTEVDEIDKRIVRVLCGDFPLVTEPYKVLASRVGLDETEFLDRVRNLRDEKKIRKMGAVLRHVEAGFKANVLCAWEVPAGRLAYVAGNMSAHPAVSHCYERSAAEGWPYNLYTMIHAKSRCECQEIVNSLAETNDIKNLQMLYSVKEWKKSSMRYFI